MEIGPTVCGRRAPQSPCVFRGSGSQRAPGRPFCRRDGRVQQRGGFCWDRMMRRPNRRPQLRQPRYRRCVWRAGSGRAVCADDFLSWPSIWHDRTVIVSLSGSNRFQTEALPHSVHGSFGLSAITRRNRFSTPAGTLSQMRPTYPCRYPSKVNSL